jgi:hypothetical protein
LGALISNYGGVKYSGTFSKIGSFSPAYWIVANQFNNYITTSTADLSGTRVYFVAGSNESSGMTSDIATVKNNMQAKGLTPANTMVKLDAYGQHNENYWKGEFKAAYQWLFATTPLKTKDAAKKKLIVGFEKNEIFIKGLPKSLEGKIYDMSGKLLVNVQLKNGWNALKSSLPKGNYILQTESESVRFLVK